MPHDKERQIFSTLGRISVGGGWALFIFLFTINSGIPLGLILGHVQFNLYVFPLADAIYCNGMRFKNILNTFFFGNGDIYKLMSNMVKI